MALAAGSGGLRRVREVPAVLFGAQPTEGHCGLGLAGGCKGASSCSQHSLAWARTALPGDKETLLGTCS